MLHRVRPAVPRLLDYPSPLHPHDELLLTRAAGTEKEEQMLRTDDGSYIPNKYTEFVEVFSKTKAETLAPHRSIDHAIDLEQGCQIPYGRIYNLSEVELNTLKAYIETNLANGFI